MTEPVAKCAAAALEPVEATEHVPMLVRGSARPVVRDRDHGPAVMAIDRDGHLGGWSHPAPAGCWTVMRYCDGFEHACQTRVLSPTSSISMGRAILRETRAKANIRWDRRLAVLADCLHGSDAFYPMLCGDPIHQV